MATNQQHKPAKLQIEFEGGDTREASEAIAPLLNKFSKSLAEVDAPLNGMERGMVGTFVLWLLAEGECADGIKITRVTEEEESA